MGLPSLIGARRQSEARDDQVGADGPAVGRTISHMAAIGARGQGSSGVPPVGVEPTLGTLLGGRPLPLGYGGSEMIPRAVRIMHA